MSQTVQAAAERRDGVKKVQRNKCFGCVMLINQGATDLVVVSHE